MRKQLLYISPAVLLTTIFLGGCSNPNKHACNYAFEQRFITLTTEPSDARVTLVQALDQPSYALGRTPLNSFPVPVMMRLKSENVPITPQEYAMHLGNAVARIEHEGYESYYGPLNTHPSGTAEHHIVLRPLAK
jgi:hypothetical protein